MSDSGDRNGFSHRSGPVAGTIRRIRLENFMCHSNLEIEFCDYVNFITGQNGSGKSAILTALCIAFGCRAKSTNRATSLKDFIKTGCSYAAVLVEIKNEGQDAYKPEVYGDTVIVERRITESTTSTVIKDQRGKKISGKKEELRELVEHFNIDVENPCVIMSQDKSREFLHSGNSKDKFKFFFKATLLQQVDDLLRNIEELLESANELIHDLEKSIEPIVRELSELQEKIKNMEHIEELSEKVKQMKVKLAWSWVYDVDRELLKQSQLVEKLKTRVPACEGKINQKLEMIENLRSSYQNNRRHYENMVQKTSEVKRMKNELQENLSTAGKSMEELEEEYRRRMGDVQRTRKKLKSLEQQVHEMKEQDLQNTQAEESIMLEKLKELQDEIDDAHSVLTRLKEEENSLFESLTAAKDEMKNVTDQLEDYERKLRDIKSSISELRRHQTNKVTAFGGDKVIQLLRIIELRYREFTKPPIGPIGSHVTLIEGDAWAFAIENAVGRLLNAFIVTNVKDSHLLRLCARQARYDHLPIIIYDFSVPRYNIPFHQLPQTRHPTILSVLHSDNATVLNVLVDKGSVERQVLVQNYEVGKTVAFEERVSNLKEVYTAEGHKMFSRGSVQTILPPNKRARAGRLCSSYDDQIKNLEKEASYMQEQALIGRQRKRAAEQELNDLQQKLQSAKRRCHSKERDLSSKKLILEDVKRSYAAETAAPDASSVDELGSDILRIEAEIQEKEATLEKLDSRVLEARDKVNKLRGSLTNLHESTNEDIKALNEAEEELTRISKQLEDLEMEKSHYEKLLNEKILPDIKLAEEKYQELEHKREESYEKASYICPESDVKDLVDCKDTSPEQFSAQLTRMTDRLQRAKDRCTESIDDLRVVYEKKQRKIFKKQKIYKNFRQQLEASQKAINSRRVKFNRNATLLKRQLTWNFNSHLGKKGISGNIKVNYEEKTLMIEVKMPQDASSTAVRDTRGLSGGERSFSTLCFALALHQMTEAPFRAMDEFDVFMDAVSRKISLDTLIDFALSQGSQWIFITPHDISMVKQNERVKKQQMAAPRS